MPLRSPLASVLLLSLVPALATTASAATLPAPGETVYWSETAPQPGPGVAGPSFIKAGIGLGGATPVVQTIVSGTTRIKGPNGLEAPDGRLWWPDQQLGTLSTALPNGSDRYTIAVGNPYDLDIEGGTLYYTTLNSHQIHVIGDPYAAAPTSSVLMSGLSNPSAVDATGSFLYWSEVAGTDRLRRSNLDGSNAVTLVTGIQSYDFEVTSQYIYLSTTFGEVVRTQLDGSGRTTLASGVGFLTGIDVTDSAIYVSTLFGEVKAMDLAGQDLTTLYTAPAGSQLRGVVVLSAVPEPSAAALWLAGAGVLGLLARRRRGAWMLTS